jgi:chorismate-pyruvate lyase
VEPDTVDGSSGAHAQGWASLLEWFYLRSGLPLPHLEQVKPDRLPNPYRALLAHSSDMTPTLEAFYEQPLGLTVLSSHRGENSYRREVLLTIGSGQSPVLYGVIRVLLQHLPESVRRRVLEERFPLGHILQTEGTPHLSWPQSFFIAQSDVHMARALKLTGACRLYGRRNVLVDGSRRLLAEVIEVLGPVLVQRER